MADLLGKENLGGGIVERTYRHYDGDKKIITTHRSQDAEPIMDANKRSYNDSSGRFGRGDMHKVASFPPTLIEGFCKVKQIPFGEFMRAKTDRAKSAWNELLNSPDFRYFRTRPGRVVAK